MPSSDSHIFLDVGSTNSRAWLVRDGAIVRRETAAVGVRDSARDGSTARVRTAVRELIAAVGERAADSSSRVRIAAAGMITSPLGLAEVPHVTAPAGAEDLARAAVMLDAPDVADAPILLVPGVRTMGSVTPDGDVDPGANRAANVTANRHANGTPNRDAGEPVPVLQDVMRGEETLVIGLVALGHLQPGSALLNAGSHWKLIRVDEHGRVASSRTSLGGEVVHAVSSGTLLSASLPDGPLTSADTDWLEAGATTAQREGLLRAMFEVRLLDQRGTTTAEERYSFLMGACITADLEALVARNAIGSGSRLLVSGPAAVPTAWAHLLRRIGADAAILDTATSEQALVTGLTSVLAARPPLSPFQSS